MASKPLSKPKSEDSADSFRYYKAKAYKAGFSISMESLPPGTIVDYNDAPPDGSWFLINGDHPNLKLKPGLEGVIQREVDRLNAS